MGVTMSTFWRRGIGWSSEGKRGCGRGGCGEGSDWDWVRMMAPAGYRPWALSSWDCAQSLQIQLSVRSGAENDGRVARQAGCHAQVHREQERRKAGVVKGEWRAKHRAASARLERDRERFVMR
jgi:hypothetical protein